MLFFPVSQIYPRIRLCRPERYGIRRTVRDLLVSHTTELDQFTSREADATTHQEFPLFCVAQNLKMLVRLIDEVLLDEYCNDHGSLDTVDIQQDYPTCDFCGSCLFLSSFSCRRCSQETSGHVLICAGCYVEGRSCHCDDMNPVRLGNFQDVLRDRNNAVGSLTKSYPFHHIVTEGFVEVSER